MRVFVGLSGGVDSAVSAARLLDAGHEVVGVFIKVWHPDFLVCNWEAERLDAMRVAAHLGIPFLTCDAEAAYRDAVAHHFIEEYRSGRTPNPDVLCNQTVKFGAFLTFARAHGADHIATGHYARRIDGQTGPELHRGLDPQKDQSYFLWSLSRDQLGAALFPIGDTPKARVRAEAEKRGLPVAEKRDSQGICFLGHVDIKDFLSHYVTLTPGSVEDETGRVIGTHDGASIYTIGQRHGFTLSGDVGHTPHYVVAKNHEQNVIVVSHVPPIAESGSTITLRQTVLRSPLTPGAEVAIQTRYRGPVLSAHLVEYTSDRMVLKPIIAYDRPASGQSCVLYRGSHCLGGGIIV